VAAVVLGVFVVYELIRAFHTGSVMLALLASLDILVVALVVREYRRLLTPGLG
jgi:uncharacterized membrane protein